MDCGLFGVRFLFLGHKNGAATPVDYLSTFATAPFSVRRSIKLKASKKSDDFGTLPRCMKLSIELCVEIPPKISISSFMGYLKGKVR